MREDDLIYVDTKCYICKNVISEHSLLFKFTIFNGDCLNVCSKCEATRNMDSFQCEVGALKIEVCKNERPIIKKYNRFQLMKFK